MKRTRIFPEYKEHGNAYIRLSEINGLDIYTDYQSEGTPSERSQEILLSSPGQQLDKTSPQKQHSRHPEVAVNRQGLGIFASVVPSNSVSTDKMSRTKSPTSRAIDQGQEIQRPRSNLKQRPQAAHQQGTRTSLAHPATNMRNGLVQHPSQLVTPQRSTIAYSSPAPSGKVNRSGIQATDNALNSTSQATYQSPESTIDAGPRKAPCSAAASKMSQQDDRYQQARAASELSQSLSSSTPQLNRSTTPQTQSRDKNPMAGDGIRPVNQSYVQPIASRQTMNASPSPYQIQGNQAERSRNPHMQNGTLARPYLPSLGNQQMPAPQLYGATPQVSWPSQALDLNQMPPQFVHPSIYQQFYGQSMPQPGTPKRSRDDTGADELDLLKWSKRARGPLGQTQSALPTYYTQPVSQTRPQMTANLAPPVPERVHRSPLDYVAAPNSHNANSSNRSPYILGSTPETARSPYILGSTPETARSPYILGSTPETAKVQQTPNNNGSRSYDRAQGQLLGVANTANNANTTSYSLYGRQYSHQVPNPSPSVQEPDVRPGTIMSQKIAVNDEGGQQYFDEGSSYQRPYVLDNEDLLHSETSPRVVSSQEDQSPTTQDQLQPLPRPLTYYEHTGGTLTNQPPWRTGVTANMDFKTKTFIDAHGATFATDKCGPYRYVKPKNRDQELAIIKATYQTIVDFELYLGYSPREKIHTWNSSYNEQYCQLQRELIHQWYVNFRLFFICSNSQGHTDFLFYSGRGHGS